MIAPITEREEKKQQEKRTDEVHDDVLFFLSFLRLEFKVLLFIIRIQQLIIEFFSRIDLGLKILYIHYKVQHL